MHRFLRQLQLFLLLSMAAPVIASPNQAAAAATAPPSDRIVVGIHPSPPFVIAGDDGQWSGLSIELWRIIAEDAGIAYELKPTGLKTLFEQLANGGLDLAVGALSMTPERERQIDFTHPFFISGLGIAVSTAPSSGIGDALGGLFSAQLLEPLLLVCAWLLISGLLVWLFERHRNPGMFGGHPAKGVGSGFWWALVTLTTVGYGDKAPVTLGGRMVAMVWMLASLVILSSLTAAITTSLTISNLQSTINGPDDLKGKRVATVRGSSSATWLRRRSIDYKDYPNIGEALDTLQRGDSDAVIYDAPILSYALQQRTDDHLTMVDNTFHLQYNAFALPQDSPHLEALNYAILEVVRGEQWQRLLRTYLGPENGH